MEKTTTLQTRLQDLTTVKDGKELSPLGAALAKRRGTGAGSVLILDCSGSMAEYADSEGTKIEKLRAIVEDLRRMNLRFQQLIFNNNAEWSDLIPYPAGGTNLALALAKSRDAKPAHIIVVSDGVPNSTELAFAEADQIQCRIDTFFVGPKGDPGEIFMRELATKRGGNFGHVSPAAMSELTGKIAGALTAGNPTGDSPGAIAL